MLEIRPLMNTSAEDILSFKTCCSIRAWDQNLEIHVKNVGDIPLFIPSYLDLEFDEQTRRIETLVPHGKHKINPGKFIAFYCFMDEIMWSKARRMVFYDDRGNAYPVGIGR